MPIRPRCAAPSAWSAQRPGADREATARENLRLSGRFNGMRGAELESRIDELLDRFGLAEAGDRFVRGFSGGMERRLDIALALVHRPRVLFLDEPTTGLDPEVRAEMWQEIERLGRDEGMTVLLTTHYLEEADRLAARLAIVDRGRVVVTGSPDELKRELRGDAVQVELEKPELNGARPALERIGGIRDVAHRRPHGCAPAPTTAPAPSRRCWPRSTATGSGWPRSPWPAPRSTTSTCATPAAPLARPTHRRRKRHDSPQTHRLHDRDRTCASSGASPGGSP